MTDAQQLIHALHLQPLPGEGGLYRETYRSVEAVSPSALPGRYQGSSRLFGTAILYLLTADPAVPNGAFSAFHRLLTDEIYHFYLGDPLEMTLLHPDGSSRQVILGQDVPGGQQVQVVVPHGVWQATCLLPRGNYALVGTTMAPGFSPEDYEHGERETLLAQYPQERERILALTRVV